MLYDAVAQGRNNDTRTMKLAIPVMRSWRDNLLMLNANPCMPEPAVAGVAPIGMAAPAPGGAALAPGGAAVASDAPQFGQALAPSGVS